MSHWGQAYARFFQKLAGRPTIHRNIGVQSVWLTSELFEFKPVIDAETGEIVAHRLFDGIKKFPVGEIELRAHRDFLPPASLHVSVHAGRWHVSFNAEDGAAEPSEKETIEWLEEYLAKANLSIFMVTHDLDSLHRTCDRIAVLADRRLIACAPVAEVEKLDHPWVQSYFHGPRGRAARDAHAANRDH